MSYLHSYRSNFYPRPPGGGRRRPKKKGTWVCNISIHALRVEGDCSTQQFLPFPLRFLSTPSGWRATSCSALCKLPSGFLSTPSGWRATITKQNIAEPSDISIHALRVEGDRTHPYPLYRKQCISIHALRVEGDINPASFPPPALNFYPRPPGGGRLRGNPRLQSAGDISIHALRVEGDIHQKER